MMFFSSFASNFGKKTLDVKLRLCKDDLYVSEVVLFCWFRFVNTKQLGPSMRRANKQKIPYVRFCPVIKSDANLSLVPKFISHSLKSLQIFSKAPNSEFLLPHFTMIFVPTFFMLLKQNEQNFVSVLSTAHVASQIIKVNVAPSN